MRCFGYLTLVVVAATALGGGSAMANVCEAGRLLCATTMPVGGYCECTAHGVTEEGTAVSRPMSRRQLNSTAGGCGAHPNAPGCR